MHVHERETYNF